jgi:hypothetical protein
MRYAARGCRIKSAREQECEDTRFVVIAVGVKIAELPGWIGVCFETLGMLEERERGIAKQNKLVSYRVRATEQCDLPRSLIADIAHFNDQNPRFALFSIVYIPLILMDDDTRSVRSTFPTGLDFKSITFPLISLLPPFCPGSPHSIAFWIPLWTSLSGSTMRQLLAMV